MKRRRFVGLTGLLVGSVMPRWAAARSGAVRFAATYSNAAGRHRLGLLDASGEALRVVAEIELPTRAHGLLIEPEGSVLAAARRPGDWVMRWSPGSGAARWSWSPPERRRTGHLVRDAAGRWLYSAETDTESGQGLIAVRDAQTLALRAEWPTHGIDPHQFIVDADGSLLVANGGVPTQAETGRTRRDMERMDASLVRLDGRSGALLGQWRLADARLSIRHLARGVDGTVGIALQGEHDDVAVRSQAPVLALFDGAALRAIEAPQRLAGYGGDIVATSSGFAVSAPRAGGVARFDPEGRWLGLHELPGACALATADGKVWAGGSEQVQAWGGARPSSRVDCSALQLDNHWVALAPG